MISRRISSALSIPTNRAASILNADGVSDRGRLGRIGGLVPQMPVVPAMPVLPSRVSENVICPLLLRFTRKRTDSHPGRKISTTFDYSVTSLTGFRSERLLCKFNGHHRIGTERGFFRRWQKRMAMVPENCQRNSTRLFTMLLGRFFKRFRAEIGAALGARASVAASAPRRAPAAAAPQKRGRTAPSRKGRDSLAWLSCG